MIKIIQGVIEIIKKNPKTFLNIILGIIILLMLILWQMPNISNKTNEAKLTISRLIGANSKLIEKIVIKNDNQIEAAQSQIDQLDALMQELLKKLGTSTKENERLYLEVEGLRAEKKALEKEKEDLIKSNKELATLLSEANNSLSELKKAKDEEIDSLKKELVSIKNKTNLLSTWDSLKSVEFTFDKNFKSNLNKIQISGNISNWSILSNKLKSDSKIILKVIDLKTQMALPYFVNNKRQINSFIEYNNSINEAEKIVFNFEAYGKPFKGMKNTNAKGHGYEFNVNLVYNGKEINLGSSRLYFNEIL